MDFTHLSYDLLKYVIFGLTGPQHVIFTNNDKTTEMISLKPVNDICVVSHRVSHLSRESSVTCPMAVRHHVIHGSRVG